MIQCIIQFLSGQHTLSQTHIHTKYTSRETQIHTHTHLESGGKSQRPGGRKSCELLRGRWPVGKNRDGYLSCCECNLYSVHDHTSWKEPLAACGSVCVCLCECCTYVQTVTCTEANLYLIPACGLVWLSVHIWSFSEQLLEHPPKTYRWSISSSGRQVSRRSETRSGYSVNQWTTQRRRVGWHDAGEKGRKEERGKRRRRLMEEELPLGY